MLKAMKNKGLKRISHVGTKAVQQARLCGRGGVEYDLFRLAMPPREGARPEEDGPVLLRIRKEGTLVIEGRKRRVRAGDTLLIPLQGFAPSREKAGFDLLTLTAVSLLLLSLLRFASLIT